MVHWIFMSLAGIIGYVFGMRKSTLLKRPFNATKLAALAMSIASIVLASFAVWYGVQFLAKF